MTVLSKSYQGKEQEEGRSGGERGKEERSRLRVMPAIKLIKYSIYPPDLALVLICLLLSPFFPLILPFSCFFPRWLLLRTVMWGYLYCVFTCIHTSDWQRPA
jgi:hypothetical protein